ncbi:MAG: hypothetical protein DDT40_01527 [candidate division WS2 bacterium]|nr:hypothetical protein [Candidatus Psychracetigena formicireducens]
MTVGGTDGSATLRTSTPTASSTSTSATRGRTTRSARLPGRLSPSWTVGSRLAPAIRPLTPTEASSSSIGIRLSFASCRRSRRTFPHTLRARLRTAGCARSSSRRSARRRTFRSEVRTNPGATDGS